MIQQPHNIAVIGLGYVGLPLAVEFSKKYKTLGFDINQARVKELNKGLDSTLEVDSEVLELALKGNLQLTSDASALTDYNVYIVTVPTPVDQHVRPILTPLVESSKTIAQVLKKGDIVIYESTVYPGVTEDECVPVLERESGLVFNEDFYVGYSPERINPGDKTNTLTKIKKVTSGSTPEVGKIVDELYNSILENGTHLAPSIKVAEAAKVIENAQRDVNIAFMNELAKIFHELGIDTNDVLDAAATKWNFLRFSPGLVGGHCIGVDPYYLAQKAQEVGYQPNLILSSRRLNDGMGKYVAERVIKLMIKNRLVIRDTPVLILGLSFKENCPDIRNTKVIDIIAELKSYGVTVDVHDPWVDEQEVENEYGIQMLKGESQSLINKYQVVIMAVSHTELLKLDFSSPTVVFDVKASLDRTQISDRL